MDLRTRPNLLLLLVAAVGSSACGDWTVRAITRPAGEATLAPPLESVQDTIVFGDVASEDEHALEQTQSEVVTGGLGEPARRLLPKDPAEIYGGEVAFSMRIHPRRQNYLTVKFWGSDVVETAARLLVHCEGRQLGYRLQGDHELLHEFASEPALPGRFFYVTIMVPLSMTSGRERVTLQIVSTGRIAPFSQTTYENYQRALTEPSGGLYRAYTHVDPFFDASGERQGTVPPASLRPAPSGDPLASVQSYVEQVIADWLAAAELTPHEVLVLAMAYRTSWSSAFQNPAVIEKIVEQIDRAASAHALDPSRFGGGLAAAPPLGEVVDPFYPELGSHVERLKGAGPIGAAVDLLYAELSARLEERVAVGSSDPVLRRAAWATLLESSREQLRTTSRGQLLAEHELWVDTGIYQANLGLSRLEPERALPEAQARRYLYEATGVSRALGNDTQSGSQQPFGSAYSMFSRTGLGLSLGYASAHGELIDRLVYLWQLTGDPQIRERALLSARARAFFRYPSVDANGHRAMRLEGPTGYRTAEYPAPVVYAARRAELAAAAAFLEPDLLGHAQQALADRQVFDRVEDRSEPDYIERLLRLPEQYAAVSAEAASPHRLPMTDGQPDTVFTDEDAGIVAIRRGDEILYAALYRRALAVTGVARVHHVRADLERLATVEVDVQFRTDGEFWTRPDVVDWMPGGSSFEPPDAPRQAFFGERALFARAPEDATDRRPFDGKADFYRLRYASYLIGMNTSVDRSYELRLPLGIESAPDLVSGQTIVSRAIVGPHSTRVLHLPDAIDARPRPFAPRFLTVSAEGGDILLDWAPVSGASSYRVDRAPGPGGAYVTLAASVSESGFVDQSSVNGQTQCYIVVAKNEYGESAPSPELCARLPPETP